MFVCFIYVICICFIYC